MQAASTGNTFDILKPSTRQRIAILPDMGQPEANFAIDVAYQAQKEWAACMGKDRDAVLRRLYDLILANCDDLAVILTAEMGKPLAEAKSEILYQFMHGAANGSVSRTCHS
ncbi:aldehyde dehydrogenase family protein [Parasulfitobacter algicola]|uniref:Aldehyde dehydrogenase family protein n=1 Tax=Parasulfitobacter algicola TaxID=2614809 RepID=A0ABX2IT58_9RHOB|nr:aldehyde dehydrogenase family protein [Sulfitobacter algicola]NSX56087.1 aldehyde dehydrogenase family protein [Sulfitobacter algicola]